MGRTTCLLAALLLGLATESSAIELKWSDGSSQRTFGAATRCTLVVAMEPPSSPLPAEWRLLWVAVGFDTLPVVADSIACIAPNAGVVRFDPPATLADSAANMSFAQFCSSSEPASHADYVLDFPSGSSGKLRVVALDPADSTQVLESNEVTFNGGAEGQYPPVLMRASSTHEGGNLVVEAYGYGLSGIHQATLGAADSSWNHLLQIIDRTADRVTAVAATIAPTPDCMMNVEGQEVSAYTELPHEPADPPPALLWGPVNLSDPEWFEFDYRPKDFFLIHAGGRIHCFYIRHRDGVPPDSTERAFGHLSTSNWIVWNTEDLNVLPARPGKWDNLHVWAPHIVLQGLTYHMFYTGVTDSVDGLGGHHILQRLGLATSTDLETWSRRDQPIFTSGKAPWTVQTGASMRDPFVMADPVVPGRWLMYYTTIHKNMGSNEIVGVAVADDSLTGQWRDLGPLFSTDIFNNSPGPGSGKVESPCLFFHDGRWHITYTTISGHPTLMQVNDSGIPYDEFPEDSANWNRGQAMDVYLHNDPPSYNWTGTEHFPLFGREFMGGYANQAIYFGEMTWRGTVPDSFALARPITNDAPPPGAGSTLSLRVRREGAAGRLVFLVDVPRRQPVRLDVFDVQGRRIRRLADETLGAGTTSLPWDGRDANGLRGPSAVYFARLTTPDGVRRTKAVLLH